MDWDHPRIRGEKGGKRNAIRRRSGSPPHTRGKGGEHVYACEVHGITPAYAGKSRLSKALARGPRDHPRIRGEKAELARLLEEIKGSPPHTRGKADSMPESTAAAGITPAYAGKSQNRFTLVPRAEDHPRIRGEKLPFLPAGKLDIGSPPHTRGKD